MSVELELQRAWDHRRLTAERPRGADTALAGDGGGFVIANPNTDHIWVRYKGKLFIARNFCGVPWADGQQIPVDWLSTTGDPSLLYVTHRAKGGRKTYWFAGYTQATASSTVWQYYRLENLESQVEPIGALAGVSEATIAGTRFMWTIPGYFVTGYSVASSIHLYAGATWYNPANPTLTETGEVFYSSRHFKLNDAMYRVSATRSDSQSRHWFRVWRLDPPTTWVEVITQEFDYDPRIAGVVAAWGTEAAADVTEQPAYCYVLTTWFDVALDQTIHTSWRLRFPLTTETPPLVNQHATASAPPFLTTPDHVKLAGQEQTPDIWQVIPARQRAYAVTKRYDDPDDVFWPTQVSYLDGPQGVWFDTGLPLHKYVTYTPVDPPIDIADNGIGYPPRDPHWNDPFDPFDIFYPTKAASFHVNAAEALYGGWEQTGQTAPTYPPHDPDDRSIHYLAAGQLHDGITVASGWHGVGHEVYRLMSHATLVPIYSGAGSRLEITYPDFYSPNDYTLDPVVMIAGHTFDTSSAPPARSLGIATTRSGGLDFPGVGLEPSGGGSRIIASEDEVP